MTRDLVCSGLLLAAGGSSRLGRRKQLIRIDNETLLRRSARMMVGVCSGEAIVVLGAQADDLVGELKGLSCSAVINRTWSVGIGSSIRCGIEALTADCDAVLVMTIDQPCVDGEDLIRLLEAWRLRPDYIVAAAYADTVGVPVIFPRRFFDELLALSGNRGGKSLLQTHIDSVVSVSMEHAGVDIDTEGDLLTWSDADVSNQG